MALKNEEKNPRGWAASSWGEEILKQADRRVGEALTSVFLLAAQSIEAITQGIEGAFEEGAETGTPIRSSEIRLEHLLAVSEEQVAVLERRGVDESTLDEVRGDLQAMRNVLTIEEQRKELKGWGDLLSHDKWVSPKERAEVESLRETLTTLEYETLGEEFETVLQIDYKRGVIYVHSKESGHTLLRICSLPSPIPHPAEYGEGLDITHMKGCSWKGGKS